jgi:hypothetical protein
VQCIFDDGIDYSRGRDECIVAQTHEEGGTSMSKVDRELEIRVSFDHVELPSVCYITLHESSALRLCSRVGGDYSNILFRPLE